MQLHSSNACNKISGLVSASLQKLSNISKPRLKFMIAVFELWLSLPVRYTMLNLSRFGAYCDKSIRLHLEEPFDFVGFNTHLIEQKCGKELIAAFDPTFIARSGKETPGLGKWWSGTQQRAVKGLELGCLSIIDVEGRHGEDERAAGEGREAVPGGRRGEERRGPGAAKGSNLG